MAIHVYDNKAEAQACKDWALELGCKVDIIELSDCVMVILYK